MAASRRAPAKRTAKRVAKPQNEPVELHQVKGGAGRSLDNLQKPSDRWATGGDPPTQAQMSFAEKLAQDAGEVVDFSKHTKASLSDWIQAHLNR